MSTIIADDGDWTARVWTVVIVLCGSAFIASMDVSMIGIALPKIGTSLHISTATLQWVISGYVLGYGGLLLLGGRAADLLGRRQVFVTSLALLALASLLGGVVSGGALLVASRVITGIAAAFMAPAGLSILTTSFADGTARHRALAVYGATGAMGYTLGLVFGGLLTELGWRYVFLVPGPIAVALVVAAIRVLPPSEPSAQARHYDIAGAVSITSAILVVVYSVVEAPSRGWGAALTLGGFAAGVLLLGVFVAVERTSTEPLVDFQIFRARTLVTANVASMLFFGSYIGFQFLATLYMQYALRWSPLHTAVAFLPAGIALPVLAQRTAPLIAKFGTAMLIASGLLAFAGGYALFLRAHLAPSYVTTLLPVMLVLGLGWGLGFPSLNVQATTGIDPSRQGLASGLFITSLQFGGAIGLAIASAVISSHTKAEGEIRGILSAIHPTTLILVGIAGAGVITALTTIVLPTRRRGTVAPSAAGSR